jgi:hypothetical protein
VLAEGFGFDVPVQTLREMRLEMALFESMNDAGSINVRFHLRVAVLS